MIPCGGEGWGGVDLAEDKPRLSSQGQTQVLTQREDRSILQSTFQPQIPWPARWPSPCSDLQARFPYLSHSCSDQLQTCLADPGPREGAAWPHSPSEFCTLLFQRLSSFFLFFFFSLSPTKDFFLIVGVGKRETWRGLGERRRQGVCKNFAISTAGVVWSHWFPR